MGCRSWHLARLKRVQEDHRCLASLLRTPGPCVTRRMSSDWIYHHDQLRNNHHGNLAQPGDTRCSHWASCSIHRGDRYKDSGKNRGGSLCIYVNNSCCTNTDIIDKHCSPDVEFLAVKCRPFHLYHGNSLLLLSELSTIHQMQMPG